MTSYALNQLRLLPGEVQTERFPLVPEPLVLGGQPYVTEPAEVGAALDIQRATGGYALRLQFELQLAGPCMRCLDDAALTISVDAREYHDDDPAGDDELVSDYVRDDVVDVSAWARDAIALSLPDQILCRPDCAGLCVVCGRNLNDEPHTHEEGVTDPRWAALEGLAREIEDS